MRTERVREGVTAEVNAAMNAVLADVVWEDGLLLRQCPHGERHPVGHLYRSLHEGDADRHTVTSPSLLGHAVSCCGCCLEWTTGVSIADAITDVEERRKAL